LYGRSGCGLLDGRGGSGGGAAGTAEQIENAAEIGMEHNLGLTCDPVRAGADSLHRAQRHGSVKAINAARLAMRGDGTHKVSLDQVIATMRQTGADMSTIYKETSQGGLRSTCRSVEPATADTRVGLTRQPAAARTGAPEVSRAARR